MNKDKISIIIPIYNVEKYITECITSVVNQTYKNLEIICIDDCGNDNSIEILNDFASKDSRIKIIKHAENKGLPQARNTGIDAASGDYIFFLDSDDFIQSDIIEKMYNKICETNSDIIISSIKAFAEDKENKNLELKATKSSVLYNLENNYKVKMTNLEEAFYKLPCVSWGKLFSIKFIKENQLRFIEQNAKYEDNGFFLKILANFPSVSFIEDLGVMYRIRGNSITATMDDKKKKKEKLQNMKLVLDDSFKYINNHLSNSDAKKFKKSIKNIEAFPWYFKTPLDFIINIKWSQNNKKIEIFRLPVLREKIKRNKKILSIFWIPIKSSNFQNT